MSAISGQETVPELNNPFIWFNNSNPLSVNRYFWVGLWGESGWVNAIKSSANAGSRYFLAKFTLSFSDNAAHQFRS